MDDAVTSQLLVSTIIANQVECYLQGLICLFLLCSCIPPVGQCADMRVAILLGWDHAKRAEVKSVEEVFDEELTGEEDPLSLLHKGDNRRLEEGQMFSGGLVGALVLAVSSLYCVHGAVVKGAEGHGGRGDPAAGQSGGGVSQNQREGGNPG